MQESPRISGCAAPPLVLLVEDEHDLARITARILQASGYEVITAADGSAAVEQLKLEPRTISLLLTDLHLPDILGTDLAAQVRTLRPGIRVLFVTGSAGDPRGNAELVGAGERLLGKPFTMAELQDAVDAALGGLHSSSGGKEE